MQQEVFQQAAGYVSNEPENKDMQDSIMKGEYQLVFISIARDT